MHFEWDENKDRINRQKHGVSFSEAQHAFADEFRVIARDSKHSSKDEERFFCYGKVGEMIMTVRFTYRAGKIRIFGAGFWREGKKVYEKANKI